MRAVIYARVSSDSQDVDLSISAQVRALREHAAKNGYEVVREFVDEAESGRTAARPAFREMIALARTKHPPFDTILVWKLNRFARSRIDSITYKTLLKDRGIKVISMNEPLDDTPSGRMLEGVIETMDQFYSENMGEDIKRGLRESAQRGFYTGSKPPYGLHKVPAKDGNKTRYKLEPDPEDSTSLRVVRRIYDRALKDMGCKEIAKVLNREGLRTGTGQLWGKTTVHKVLTNEAYCGILVLGGRPGHPALHSGIPPVRVENAWPAIIDKGTFLQIQAMMASKKPEITHPRTVPSTFLFSGFIFCSCGHAMIGRSAKSHQYYYYTCNGNFKQGAEICAARALPKERLERAIVEQIREKVLNNEWLEELVELVNKELDSSHTVLGDRLDAIDADLNEVRLRLSRLYEALETSKLSLDDLAPRIKEQRARESELSKARLQVEAEMLVQGPNHVDGEMIKAHARDLKAILEEADLMTSKAFLRTFIKRIEIKGDEAIIRYALPVPPRGKTTDRVSVLPIDTPSGPEGTIPRTDTVSCLAPSGGNP
jgi:DNA invertase Pin-like site-specific DNA recombinase